MNKNDNPIVKASICQDCGGWVRVAGLTYLEENTKARNEFAGEVMRYNLMVKEYFLSKWQDEKLKRCECL